MLTNLHCPPPEGNICDEHGNALKPMIVHDCNRHMGYVDKSDCMTKSYSIGSWTWKCLLDLTILNSFIIIVSCGSEFSHRLFRLAIIRDIIQEAGQVPQPQTTRHGRQASSMNQLTRLDIRHRHSIHWRLEGKRIQCFVCSANNKEIRAKFRCPECSVGVSQPMFQDVLHEITFLETNWH
jgi:hypothetical protein